MPAVLLFYFPLEDLFEVFKALRADPMVVIPCCVPLVQDIGRAGFHELDAAELAVIVIPSFSIL